MGKKTRNFIPLLIGLSVLGIFCVLFAPSFLSSSPEEESIEILQEAQAEPVISQPEVELPTRLVVQQEAIQHDLEAIKAYLEDSAAVDIGIIEQTEQRSLEEYEQQPKPKSRVVEKYGSDAPVKGTAVP